MMKIASTMLVGRFSDVSDVRCEGIEGKERVNP
jgi:hypothetical protein